MCLSMRVTLREYLSISISLKSAKYMYYYCLDHFQLLEERVGQSKQQFQEAHQTIQRTL